MNNYKELIDARIKPYFNRNAFEEKMQPETKEFIETHIRLFTGGLQQLPKELWLELRDALPDYHVQDFTQFFYFDRCLRVSMEKGFT